MIFEVCFEKIRGVLQKQEKFCKMWDFVLQRIKLASMRLSLCKSCMDFMGS